MLAGFVPGSGLLWSAAAWLPLFFVSSEQRTGFLLWSWCGLYLEPAIKNQKRTGSFAFFLVLWRPAIQSSLLTSVV